MKRARIGVMAALLWVSGAAHALSGDDAVRAAFAAQRAHDAAALAAAAAQVPRAHPLASYVEFWRLRTQLPDAAPATVSAFLAREPDSRTAYLLRRDWLKSLGAKQDWSRFLAEFRHLDNPDDELACYARRAELAQGNTREMKAAATLWFSGRDLPNACDPLFNQLFAMDVLDASAVWQRLRLALDAGNPNVARVVAGRLPASEFDPAQLDLAARDPGKLLAEVPQKPTRGTREVALYAIEQLARKDTGRAEIARARWAAVMSETEQAVAWGAVALWAARRHEPVAMSAFAHAGPQALSDIQREWWVRAALRAGDFVRAGLVIDTLGETTRAQPEWRYWRGRAYQFTGQPARARQLFLPLAGEPHFYGQLAQEELGATLNLPPVNVKPGEAEIAAAAALPGVQRAFALRDLDWRSEANLEWNHTARTLTADRQKLAMAELARRAGWYDRAIYAAEQTQEHHDFELRFITPYRDLARAAAREHGLDEAWIYGLMRQESRFINVARSGVGASGLMQIMPATARWIARKLGAGKAEAARMNDPSTNIRFGSFYLAHVQQQLGGSPVLATAAYNAGPSRAQRWRPAAAMEGAIWVETIPFTETRDYVKKVLSNAMYYAARFNQPSVLLTDRLGRVPPRGK